MTRKSPFREQRPKLVLPWEGEARSKVENGAGEAHRRRLLGPPRHGESRGALERARADLGGCGSRTPLMSTVANLADLEAS